MSEQQQNIIILLLLLDPGWLSPLMPFCTYQCKAGGGRRAWGGDLIVFVGPGVGHLTDLVLPGEGIFESFFARRRDI